MEQDFLDESNVQQKHFRVSYSKAVLTQAVSTRSRVVFLN